MQIETHRQNNFAIAAAAFESLAETERQRVQAMRPGQAMRPVQAMRPPRLTNCTANSFGYNTTIQCW